MSLTCTVLLKYETNQAPLDVPPWYPWVLMLHVTRPWSIILHTCTCKGRVGRLPRESCDLLLGQALRHHGCLLKANSLEAAINSQNSIGVHVYMQGIWLEHNK